MCGQVDACDAARQHALQKLLASPDTLLGVLVLAILNAIDASGLGQIPDAENSPSLSVDSATLRCLGTLAAQGFQVPNMVLSRSLGRTGMEHVSVCLWECLVLRLRRLLTALENRAADGPIKVHPELVKVLKTVFSAATNALDTAAATEVVTLVV